MSKKHKLHIEGAESERGMGRDRFHLLAGKEYVMTADKIPRGSKTLAEMVPGRDNNPDQFFGELVEDGGNPHLLTSFHNINAPDLFADGTDYIGTVTVWMWTKDDYSDIEVVGVVTIVVDA